MMIRVPNAAGSDMSAYMAIPKAGKGAGVVVLQEIFGVTDSMKKICDFLADRQFTAICPDLYWSVEPDARLVERWLPDDARPEICDERLTWHPEGATEPLTIDLSALFVEAIGA